MVSYYDLLDTYEDDSDYLLTKRESKRKAKILRRTLANETYRGTFRNIRKVVNPSERSAGLKNLLAPSIDPLDTTVPLYSHLQETDPADL